MKAFIGFSFRTVNLHDRILKGGEGQGRVRVAKRIVTVRKRSLGRLCFYRCLPLPPSPADTTRYGQWAGGTYPTGMHSCLPLWIKRWVGGRWEHVPPTSSLLAFIDKYGVLTNQWTWLYEALLEVSMTKIALWIRVCADDWAGQKCDKSCNECL